MRPVCYMDLDGVLVDFVAGALKLHKKELPHAEVRWGIEAQLGLTPEQFWAPLGHDFWAGLGWTPEGRSLLAEAEALFGDEVALMTSHPDTPGGAEGKVEWVKRHLPEYRSRLFVGRAKHLTAGPGKVLVDDHDPNTDRFEAFGGRVVLVPRPWNRRAAVCLAHGRFDVAAVAADLYGAWAAACHDVRRHRQ